MTDTTSFVEVTSADHIREILGEPEPHVVAKERFSLSEIDRDWLRHSPFCLVATSDQNGHCDVSPKGDPAGFTYVIDDHTIALPERPGNKRADGFYNLIQNPHVGLLYFIPGRGDTLRINGRAKILADAPFFEHMLVKGHRPKLALLVQIEQIFFHCSKAFMRSQLWEPTTWDPQALPSRPQIASQLDWQQRSIKQLEEYYGPQYKDKLYKNS